MKEETTIDEKTISLKLKLAIPIMFSLLVVSNGFTAYSYQIDENAKDVLYNEEKTARKLKNQLEKVEQLIYISELKSEIKVLKKELKHIEDEK